MAYLMFIDKSVELSDTLGLGRTAMKICRNEPSYVSTVIGAFPHVTVFFSSLPNPAAFSASSWV
jgi:hypothetical protein